MLKNATRNEEGKVSSLMERVTLPVPTVQVERPSQDQPKEQSQGQRNGQGQEEKPIKGQVECESQEQTKNQSQLDRERSDQGQVEFQSQGQTKSQGEGERSCQGQTECQSQGQTKCQSQGPTGQEKRSNQDQVQRESHLQTKNQSQHDGDRSGQVDFPSQGQTKCESQGQAERQGLPLQQSLGKTKGQSLGQGQSSNEVQAESKSNAIDTKTQPNACVSPSDNPTQLVLAAPNLLPGNIIYYNLKNQPLALKDCNVNSIQFVKLVGVPSKETTSRQPETPPLMKKNDELSLGGCGRATSTTTSTTTHNTRMPVQKISGLVLPFNNWGKSILPVSKSSRDKSENFMESSTREATLQQAIPKVTTPGL